MQDMWIGTVCNIIFIILVTWSCSVSTIIGVLFVLYTKRSAFQGMINGLFKSHLCGNDSLRRLPIHWGDWSGEAFVTCMRCKICDYMISFERCLCERAPTVEGVPTVAFLSPSQTISITFCDSYVAWQGFKLKATNNSICPIWMNCWSSEEPRSTYVKCVPFGNAPI